jgi:hypothetical protein
MQPGDAQQGATHRLERLEDRRRSAEAALWTLPGLSIAAQAFLSSTGLAHDATSTARFLAGAIGLVIAVGTGYALLYVGSRWLVLYLSTDPHQSLDAPTLIDELEKMAGVDEVGSVSSGRCVLTGSGRLKLGPWCSWPSLSQTC